MKTEAGAVIDVTEDASASASDASSGRSKRSREEPPAPARRTHRKTESRVLFSDVMAQEREMERITHAKSRAPMLRKGETAESPVQRSKQKRTEERRSARQKLRRNMSPRSPDGGPQPLRTGVALPALDGVDAALQPQRRFARDEDAIQDATLHSTAWRNVRLEAAPANVLPDTEGLLPPYALQLDAPLEAFDAELRSKCALSAQFLKPKSLSLTSGSLAEEKEKTLLDDRVKALVDEATPLVKNSHAARANAVIANTRQQIAAYLEQRLVVREQTMAISGLPLDVSKLEKVAARRLLRDAEFVPEGMDRPHYSIGRTEADHSGRIYPEMVTYLSKIAPIPRSTTCMLARGTHRVEDDPIIRFVPYFSAAKNKPPEFTSADRCKDTLVGMDNEINEYVLRYVVRQCGGDQSVFEALQRCGAFNQPFANYSDILERVTREQLYKRHLQELEERRNSDEIPVHRKRAIDSLLKECSAVRDGAYLRGRLQPLPSHVVVNHLQQSGDLVLMHATRPLLRKGMRLLSGLLQSFSWMSLRDVCTSCGASELPVVIADPKSKTKTVAQLKICGNVNIMRGQMRKIGVAASATHGWGAYALEDAEEGDFMYEYTGSLLSQDEAERRGNVYDKTTISFLFDLNEDSVVDATRKGNKSKFANHDSAGPKCFARIMLVNGDHRIGIYAKEDITTGDELFFDYGYSGVIPDWSQARIGSGKDAPSMEEEEDAEATPAEVKQEAES
uniref:SET domain-containing protein n=1 Tax=Phytophthora fragariae TaxID=53985 RepID=A0A6A3E417_9STRA|nr:hypothetical protein PF009_g24216 [Phytophthora fragariae]